MNENKYYSEDVYKRQVYNDSQNDNQQATGTRTIEPPRNENNRRQEPNTNQNNSENWVTVHENPGFSIMRDPASNDEGPRTAQVNHIRAETSQGPNDNPRNETNIEDDFSYAERVWPQHVVRW